MTNKSRLPIGTALQVSYFFNSWNAKPDYERPRA